MACLLFMLFVIKSVLFYAVAKCQSSKKKFVFKNIWCTRKYFYLKGIFYLLEAKEYQESACRENFWRESFFRSFFLYDWTLCMWVTKECLVV